MSFAVPVVDITPFTRGGDGDAREAVAQAVDDAARRVGFLQVVGHGIPEATVGGLTTAMDAFFALPPEVKLGYRQPPGINRGYSPPLSERLAYSLGKATAADLFEAFNVGAEQAWYPGVDLPPDDYAANTFPAEVAGFEAAVMAYFRAAAGVARTMTRIFTLALDLDEQFFPSITDHSVDVLRMNNYRLPAPDLELAPDQLGMGAHTDYGIVTVLWADQVPGLEVMGPDGAWNPIQPVDGGLLVNLGDALARWTNDTWVSTMHRVAPPRVGGRLVPRRSAAFFHDGNVDALISCLPSCADAERPPLYPPVTVAEHLAEKLGGSRGGVLNANAEREAARLG